jgi:hypothetical protein
VSRTRAAGPERSNRSSLGPEKWGRILRPTVLQGQDEPGTLRKPRNPGGIVKEQVSRPPIPPPGNGSVVVVEFQFGSRFVFPITPALQTAFFAAGVGIAALPTLPGTGHVVDVGCRELENRRFEVPFTGVAANEFRNGPQGNQRNEIESEVPLDCLVIALAVLATIRAEELGRLEGLFLGRPPIDDDREHGFLRVLKTERIAVASPVNQSTGHFPKLPFSRAKPRPAETG